MEFTAKEWLQFEDSEDLIAVVVLPEDLPLSFLNYVIKIDGKVYIVREITTYGNKPRTKYAKGETVEMLVEVFP